jgi:serine/threonine protein kinase
VSGACCERVVQSNQRATDLATGARVAVKHSYWRLMRERPSQENPMREARILQLLAPVPRSIVRVREVSFDAEKHWLVLAHCERGDLSENIDRLRRRSSLAHAWCLFDQLVAAVAHCHVRGVAHLDVRAQNCLLNADDELVLGDFGQAREFPLNARGHEAPFAAHVRDSLVITRC